jgi:hypothetical protein
VKGIGEEWSGYVEVKARSGQDTVREGKGASTQGGSKYAGCGE